MKDIDESRFVITGDWLSYDVGRHTCGTGPDGHFGAHEPGCGLEPVCRLSEIANLVAERDAARAEVARLSDLFSGGPDTACRTVWREEPGLFGLTYQVECVEVPIDDLRAAFGDTAPTDEASP